MFNVCGGFNFGFIAFGAREIAYASLPIGFAASLSWTWNFTASARPLRRWQRAQVWAFLIAMWALIPIGFWLPRPEATIAWWAYRSLLVLSYLSMLGGLTRAYLRSNALERRQIRWVLYAAYVTLLPGLVAIGFAALGMGNVVVANLWALAGFALPLGVLVAVIGYRFLDVDPLISATTSLTVLGVILHEIVVHVIPDVAEDGESGDGSPGHGRKVDALARVRRSRPRSARRACGRGSTGVCSGRASRSRRAWPG